MKVSRRITGKVNDSVANCKNALVGATVQLLKEIGARSDERITFTPASGTLVLQQQANQRNITTKLADSITYSDHTNRDMYFLHYNGDCIETSDNLSLDSSLLIYNEILKVAKAE